MKKRNMIAALLCSACLVAGSVNPVFADASKVVTLGADLTDAQKQTMMKYFNVSSDQVQVMTITNEDEHKHLDNIAPQSQIGSRTLSCAYVKPTQSGGIKVRTANLNWVTGNMIATTLSTSGVKNCEVVAACPMEVSGTGALTGIQMAYEKASGEKLDETKTKLANQEIVTTGELADKVGKNEATTVVNQSKMDVIQNGVQNADEIQNIVINVAEQNNISVSQDDIDRIVSLLKQISQQDYNYDDVKETLEQVDANTTGQTSSSDDTLDGESSDETVDVDADSSDDIVNNVNDSILGDDVIQSSTEDPGLEEETGADSQDTSNETGIPDATDETEPIAMRKARMKAAQTKVPLMRAVQRIVHPTRAVQTKVLLTRTAQRIVHLTRAAQMKALLMRLHPMRPESRRQQKIQNLQKVQRAQTRQTVQKTILLCSVKKQRTIMTNLSSL